MNRGQLGLLLALMAVAYGQPRWIRMQSENFEMYSTASESNTREVLRNFEQVRSFFVNFMGSAPKKAQPVTIVGFSSEKEYAPYRFNEFAFAYYHPGADHDYIVMSKVGYDLFPVAVHEYTHLIVQNAGMRLPPWLNEGMAELYSTLKPRADKIMVGDVVPGRLQGLSREKWVPLQTIVNVDQKSPYYNEKQRAGTFYNESWALVHMLALSKDYGGKFDRLTAMVHEGAPSQTALETLYGKSLTQIDKDLQNYLGSRDFYARLYDDKLDKAKVAAKAEAAPEFELEMTLLDLASTRAKEQETRARLEALTSKYPQRPEPWAGLGYLEWRAGSQDRAAELLGKAYDLGARNPRLLWDYGRLGARLDSDKANKALEALAEQQPDRLEVKLQIAGNYVSKQQGGAAFGILKGITRVTPADAPRLFALRAYAELQLQSFDAARASVAQLEKYAKEEEDQRQLSRLKGYLAQIDAAQARGRQAGQREVPAAINIAAAPQEERVILKRREDSGAYENERPALLTMAGTFAEFVCEDQPRVVLETSGGRKSFLIEDPSLLTVVGREGGKVDLTCGPQQGTAMRVEYVTAEKPGIDGLLKILYFD